MRHFLIVAATLAVVSPRPLAAQAPQLSTRDSALHALNRLAYGPRPGEVDSVARIGVMRWIDQQLDPDRIDDAALQQREREFKILSYHREDLAQRFRDVQRERQRLQRESSPPDPLSASRRGGTGVRSEFRELGGELQQLAIVRATLSERLRSKSSVSTYRFSARTPDVAASD